MSPVHLNINSLSMPEPAVEGPEKVESWLSNIRSLGSYDAASAELRKHLPEALPYLRDEDITFGVEQALADLNPHLATLDDATYDEVRAVRAAFLHSLVLDGRIQDEDKLMAIDRALVKDSYDQKAFRQDVLRFRPSLRREFFAELDVASHVKPQEAWPPALLASLEPELRDVIGKKPSELSPSQTGRTLEALRLTYGPEVGRVRLMLKNELREPLIKVLGQLSDANFRYAVPLIFSGLPAEAWGGVLRRISMTPKLDGRHLAAVASFLEPHSMMETNFYKDVRSNSLEPVATDFFKRVGQTLDAPVLHLQPVWAHVPKRNGFPGDRCGNSAVGVFVYQGTAADKSPWFAGRDFKRLALDSEHPAKDLSTAAWLEARNRCAEDLKNAPEKDKPR